VQFLVLCFLEFEERPDSIFGFPYCLLAIIGALFVLTLRRWKWRFPLFMQVTYAGINYNCFNGISYFPYLGGWLDSRRIPSLTPLVYEGVSCFHSFCNGIRTLGLRIYTNVVRILILLSAGCREIYSRRQGFLPTSNCLNPTSKETKMFFLIMRILQ
jgi:hypothetical protein